MGRDEVPSKATAPLKALTLPEPAWVEVRYESEQTMTAPDGRVMDVVVHVHMDNLGDGVVRRSDDWRAKQGGALVYEERYLLWLNLMSLASRSRVTAPLIHAIFEDQGWLRGDFKALEASATGRPLEPGWELKAATVRVHDKVPPYDPGREEIRREIACVGKMPRNSRPVLECRASTAATSRISHYVFVREANIFILVDAQQADVDSGVHTNSKGVSRIFVDGRSIDL